jgi:capsular exopolysaccharide synthesis family protein
VKLSDYFQSLWRRKWIILFAMMITVAAVTIRTSKLTRMYSASTTLRVLTASIGSPEFIQYDVTYADRLMNTYAQMAQSRPLLEQLADQLNLTSLPNVSVNVTPETELMSVVVSSEDPARARDSANALAALLIKEIQTSSRGNSQNIIDLLNTQVQEAQTELDQARSQYAQLAAQYPQTDERVISSNQIVQLKQQIYATLLGQYENARSSQSVTADSLSVIEPATLPSSPSSPNVSLNLGLGLVVGLAIGLGLAFALENLDTTLHSTKQIEAALNLKTLARIPKKRGRKPSLRDTNSPQAEANRTLRTNLFNLSQDKPLRTIMLTSAEPNEGKSTTAAHLAVAMGQAGRKVILVDCDLCRPKQHKLFNCANIFGLSDLLMGRANIEEVLLENQMPNVGLITSGVLPADEHPAELIASDAMKKLLTQLSKLSDIVILDGPAVRVVDAVILASIADGVLLVIGRELITKDEAQTAYLQLTNVKANVLGTVINRAENDSKYGSYARKPIRVFF